MASSSVPNLYYSVIEDVIANVREAFIDEGVDEQALTELKQVWEKKLHESKAIEREPETAANKNVAQATLQPVQQQTTNLGPSASITHQLAMPPTNLVPQTLLQYTTPASGDVQKTMALNLPQKLTLTVPAHLAQSGLQTLVTAPGTTAVQLPPELASLFQGNVIASTHSSNLQHGGQQITGVHYQTLTSEQLKNAQQFTVTIPVTTPQSQASVIGQIDGANDTSDEEDEDDFPDNDDDRDDNDDEQNEDDIGEEDEEPLNSDDDVSEDDPTDLFDTENVVVCQYDKVIGQEPSRCRWHNAVWFSNDAVLIRGMGQSQIKMEIKKDSCQMKINRSKNKWKFHLKDGIMNLQGKDFVFHKALGDSEW